MSKIYLGFAIFWLIAAFITLSAPLFTNTPMDGITYWAFLILANLHGIASVLYEKLDRCHES